MPRNSIEEKDMKIDELEKALAQQKTEMSELSQLKESLTKTKAELYSVKQNYNVSIKKLNYTKNATEQKIAEAISNPDFFLDDPHLVSVYTATLNMDDFDVAETTDDLLPKNDNRVLTRATQLIQRDTCTSKIKFLKKLRALRAEKEPSVAAVWPARPAEAVAGKEETLEVRMASPQPGWNPVFLHPSRKNDEPRRS